MRAKEFILEYNPKSEAPYRELEDIPGFDINNGMAENFGIVRDYLEQLGGFPSHNQIHSNETILNAVIDTYGEKAISMMREGSKENANALVGSGRADPHGKKTNSDSKAHKAVRTPGTGPNARTKYNNGAKPGANPGFVGG